MPYSCPVCEAVLADASIGEYAQCASCSCHVYVSETRAEDDNKAFYDGVYPDVAGHKRNSIKRAIFNAFRKKDAALHAEEYRWQQEMRAEIQQAFQRPRTSVEIGFGEGRMLLRLLEAGCDTYGVDISQNVVSSFQERHPQYRDRVQIGTHASRKVDIVYCSALLEHIDQPACFLQEVCTMLHEGGLLIIDNLPVLNPDRPSIAAHEDISFWKPCHRVIYSAEGLTMLFARLGYSLTRFALADLFNYRVLSLHIRRGFPEIARLRHSCLRDPRLPGILEYYLLCREALQIRSKALAGSFIFTRTS
jgi:SAM-dependent methyltransferase